MATVRRDAARLAELKEMLDAYRHMTIEEAEATSAGDRQFELEQEVWRLEQEIHPRRTAARAA
jgi:hypothetical protein